MPLEAAMQRWPCQMRDGRFAERKAIIARQQCVPPERDNHTLLGFGHGR